MTSKENHKPMCSSQLAGANLPCDCYSSTPKEKCKKCDGNPKATTCRMNRWPSSGICTCECHSTPKTDEGKKMTLAEGAALSKKQLEEHDEKTQEYLQDEGKQVSAIDGCCEDEGQRTHRARLKCNHSCHHEHKVHCKKCWRGTKDCPLHEHKAVEGWWKEKYNVQPITIDDLDMGWREKHDAERNKQWTITILKEEADLLISSLILKAKEEERERIMNIVDQIAPDTAIKNAAKYANEVEWKQPYAGNRMIHLGWKISDAIRAAIEQPEV